IGARRTKRRRPAVPEVGDFFGRRPRKWRPARQRFVMDGGDGINVSGWASMGRPAGQLFRRHVQKCADAMAVVRLWLATIAEPCQAEVYDLQGDRRSARGGREPTRRDGKEDIGRLQVPVNETAPVNVVEGFREE